jgi:hypothetical protein
MNASQFKQAVICLAATSVVWTGYACGQAISLPSGVTTCLAKHPEVELNPEQRPPYLKVRLSTAGQPDYVVAVVYREKHATRALLCRADGSTQVLGVPRAQPFSDMYNDDYMSSEWRRCTRGELLRMAKNYRGVPMPDNEAVCLTWEDGESLIYERGGRMLWKNLAP